MDSMLYTGFQATELGRAINVTHAPPHLRQATTNQLNIAEEHDIAEGLTLIAALAGDQPNARVEAER